MVNGQFKTGPPGQSCERSKHQAVCSSVRVLRYLACPGRLLQRRTAGVQCVAGSARPPAILAQDGPSVAQKGQGLYPPLKCQVLNHNYVPDHTDRQCARPSMDGCTVRYVNHLIPPASAHQSQHTTEQQPLAVDPGRGPDRVCGIPRKSAGSLDGPMMDGLDPGTQNQSGTVRCENRKLQLRLCSFWHRILFPGSCWRKLPVFVGGWVTVELCGLAARLGNSGRGWRNLSRDLSSQGSSFFVLSVHQSIHFSCSRIQLFPLGGQKSSRDTVP